MAGSAMPMPGVMTDWCAPPSGDRLTPDGVAATIRVTYVYDAYGNRIERDAWDGTTSTTERYGLDGWDPAKPAAVGNA